MTAIEKQKITVLRQQGIGYLKISQRMGISLNTVKSYCRRHGLTNPSAIPAEVSLVVQSCQQCGKNVVQDAKRKQKKFCSDECRMKWWNSHRELIRHQRESELECPNCHKMFTGYPGRKYCSHGCYIAHRFGDSAYD